MKKAFTLLELLVVVLILGLLSTIAVGVYTRQVERAKVATARATISAIELAVARYQIDTGEYPPSGSGALPHSTPGTYQGNGYMQVALMSSLSGSSSVPLSPRWQGPYLSVKNDILGDLNGFRVDDPNRPTAIVPGTLQILDPWQQPYRYVRSMSLANGTNDPDNYTQNNGTRLPDGSDPQRPAHPFAQLETYYNASTFQISSKGPDGATLTSAGDHGTDMNDVTNFGM